MSVPIEIIKNINKNIRFGIKDCSCYVTKDKKIITSFKDFCILFEKHSKTKLLKYFSENLDNNNFEIIKNVVENNTKEYRYKKNIIYTIEIMDINRIIELIISDNIYKAKQSDRLISIDIHHIITSEYIAMTEI